MRIRFDEEIGIIEIDGVSISAAVLREIVNPDRRLLFRFVRKGNQISAAALDESQVIWLDKEDTDGQTAELGIIPNQDSNEDR